MTFVAPSAPADQTPTPPTEAPQARTTAQAALVLRTVGPLSAGSRVSLQLTPGASFAAQVTSGDGRTVSLELLEVPPDGSLETGSVVEMFIPLDMGVYKWLCIVSANPSRNAAEVQVLDAPMFVPRRPNPRVPAELPAEVRALLPQSKGPAHKAVMTDLSIGGMKLEGCQHLSAEDTIEVTVRLTARSITTDETISIMGRVVVAYPSHRSPDGGGTDAHVSFIDGQQEPLDAVERFVTEQLKRRTPTL
jgi:PilZ domain